MDGFQKVRDLHPPPGIDGTKPQERVDEVPRRTVAGGPASERVWWIVNHKLRVGVSRGPSSYRRRTFPSGKGMEGRAGKVRPTHAQTSELGG